MSTKAPTPVALGAGVSVMLTKIRTKIRQTASQFRRTKRRSSTSDSPTPSVILQRPNVSIPVEVTLPYSRPSLSQSSLISQDMVAEVDAWWMRDRQSHSVFVPGIPSWMNPLPSPLQLDSLLVFNRCWPPEGRSDHSSEGEEAMPINSHKSPNLFSVPPLQFTDGDDACAMDGISPPSSVASSRIFAADDSTSFNYNPALAMPIPDDHNDLDDRKMPNDNDTLPYYGTTLIPLPSTPISTPPCDPECVGVKRKTLELPASVSLFVLASILAHISHHLYQTSLSYSVDGPNLCVTISAPSQSESPHHNLAIDQIQRDVIYKPNLASIDVTVPPGCEDLRYAAALVNNVFSVLQGCLISPESVSIRLGPVGFKKSEKVSPLVTIDKRPLEQYETLTPMPTDNSNRGDIPDTFSDFPGLTPWWRFGRINLDKLTSLVMSFPVPLDDFLDMLARSKYLNSVQVEHLLEPRTICNLQASILSEVTDLSIVSQTDLETFFHVFAMPNLQRLSLVIHNKARPDGYNLWWDSLSDIYVQCTMTEAGEEELPY
ncbi:hypothetical protein ONZ45_g9084 [Pleurotus djamor]|nr:hypothetical protein ONZ45_g9084 [Pleurotus djamor]